MTYQEFRAQNDHLIIHNIFDECFKPYGRIVGEFDFTEAAETLSANTAIPAEGCVYEPGIAPLNALEVTALVRDNVFGGMPIQAGYCNGVNASLGALEYHKNSEVVVAGTDLCVMVGLLSDIDRGQYYSDLVEVFFVPAGTALEFYATTLHYAPCKVESEGFKSIVYLPEGTNTALTFAVDENSEGAWLTHKNKWLIAHPDSVDLVKSGAKVGIIGDNITVKA